MAEYYTKSPSCRTPDGKEWFAGGGGMTANDLISRSALIKEYEWLKSQVNSSSVSEIEEHIERIKKAPAVDAVLVVRCKDCQHQRERNEYERNYLAEGVLICTSPDATDDCWNAVWPDHFCSYGERRSSDG